LLIAGLSLGLYAGGKQLEKSQGITGANTLNLYNWGDYIDPELLSKFEEETGYRIVYETFDSNEAMYTKIQQGGTAYDLAVPSEYMIERMKEEDLLIPVDHSRLEGLENIDDEFLNLPFDPGNQYSIPYFWGTLGIVYNDKMVVGELFESWDGLWNPELQNSTLLIDGAREVMGFTLQSLGYSLTSKNMNELQQAKEKMNDLMP